MPARSALNVADLDVLAGFAFDLSQPAGITAGHIVIPALAALNLHLDLDQNAALSAPADVQPARNAGGQRAFLGGAAGVIGRGGAARSSREVLDEHSVGDIAAGRYELHPCQRAIGDACAFRADRRRSRRPKRGFA